MPCAWLMPVQTDLTDCRRVRALLSRTLRVAVRLRSTGDVSSATTSAWNGRAREGECIAWYAVSGSISSHVELMTACVFQVLLPVSRRR
jgi:hypothetical protein